MEQPAANAPAIVYGVIRRKLRLYIKVFFAGIRSTFAASRLANACAG
jgi:hypothetical protein